MEIKTPILINFVTTLIMATATPIMAEIIMVTITISIQIIIKIDPIMQPPADLGPPW